MRLAAALATLLLCGAAAPALAQPATPAPPSAADRVVLPTNVAPVSYDVAVTPDMAAMTFTGEVRIDVDVKAPTRAITLNAAELTFGRVSITGVAGAPQVSFDTEQQTATLTFPGEVSAGRHTLAIAYAGKINAHAAGLFALDYDAPKSVGGGRKKALFTQFENSDARRFVPSWDEPNKKATFTLTATVPKELMAVSNMPVASSADVSGGLKRVRFATTPKMSSYLLFFGLGDFERIHKDVDGTDVGVVVKRGATDQATYALDAATHILRYYNEYFGVKYPLPKLDMIAGSGQSQFFGAMENWGAIFYFDRDVLVDPKLATEADKQNVYIVVAHEMAHQWFGDLVTMDWWDDLWLNEGFASWMENKATDHFHPEWKLWLQAAASKDAAMRLDARAGTHPVIQPIRDVLQAQEAFDTITYSKGQAVIRMLEQYVGPDAWRDGVRRYIRAHEYANTTTDDLWRAMDEAGGPRPVTQIAHDFTLQPGVPLITVQNEPHCKPPGQISGGLRLTQSRFGVDQASKAPLVWHVPVRVGQLWAAGTDASGIASAGSETEVIVAAPKPSIAANSIDTSYAIANAGQTGYFRTLYTPATFAPVKAGFARLSDYDQLGVLNDSSALGGAGYEPYADTLDLTAAIPPNADPIVAQAMVRRLEAIDDLLKENAARSAWRAHARAVVEPLYARLGWRAKAGEPSNDALLRATVLSALGEFDDPAVLAQAREKFAAYLKNPDALEAGERTAVLQMIASHATPAEWDQLHGLALHAPTALEKADAYFRLAQARDPLLAQKALALSLTSEPDRTTMPSMVTDVGREHPQMALDFAIAHVDYINVVLEPDSRNSFIPRLAQEGSGDAAIAKLDAYAQAHIPATAQGDVVRARSAIRAADAIKARVVPQVVAWLPAHRG
ncbi:MAG: M1 family metallopeptidase [Caulobacteraceae bacterium]|nr:M1 family metallopeptidase [Caulobacter sp.]